MHNIPVAPWSQWWYPPPPNPQSLPVAPPCCRGKGWCGEDCRGKGWCGEGWRDEDCPQDWSAGTSEELSASARAVATKKKCCQTKLRNTSSRRRESDANGSLVRSWREGFPYFSISIEELFQKSRNFPGHKQKKLPQHAFVQWLRIHSPGRSWTGH